MAYLFYKFKMESLQQACIKKLYLKNFKRFNEVTVELTNGLNILVGGNNSGKSSILEAIDILLNERNLSNIYVKRSYFNKYQDKTDNISILIAEIIFPSNCGKSKNEISIIKLLKVGRGSSKSKLPSIVRSGHISFESITNSDFDPKLGDYMLDTPKGNINIDSAFLNVEIRIDTNFISYVTYDLYLNVEVVKDKEKLCYKFSNITGNQKASLFNYLFLSANRIENNFLVEIKESNWLGRYIKSFINSNHLEEKLIDYSQSNQYPKEILDKEVNKILSSIFSINEKISMNFFNTEDIYSIVTNAKFYIHDGFNDELINKAQGMQNQYLYFLLGYQAYNLQVLDQNQNL